jgi:hypothetical protein
MPQCEKTDREDEMRPSPVTQGLTGVRSSNHSLGGRGQGWCRILETGLHAVKCHRHRPGAASSLQMGVEQGLGNVGSREDVMSENFEVTATPC